MTDSDGPPPTRTGEVAGKPGGLFDIHEARPFALALVVAVALIGLLLGETLPARASVEAPILTSPTSVVYTVVPEVVGVSSSRAAGDLTSLGLQVSTILVDSNVAGRGQVIAEDPPYGAAVPPGSNVKITVSDGTPPTPR